MGILGTGHQVAVLDLGLLGGKLESGLQHVAAAIIRACHVPQQRHRQVSVP